MLEGRREREGKKSARERREDRGKQNNKRQKGGKMQKNWVTLGDVILSKRVGGKVTVALEEP